MPLEAIAVSVWGSLGVTLPQFILIITGLGSLLFMAVEIRFGLMMLFFMYGVEVIAFWSYGVAAADLVLSVMALLSVFVCMTLSLLLVKSSQTSGGIL